MTPDDLTAIQEHATQLPPHRTRGYLLELAREVRALQERLSVAEGDAREWEAEAWRVRGERDAERERCASWLRYPRDLAPLFPDEPCQQRMAALLTELLAKIEGGNAFPAEAAAVSYAARAIGVGKCATDAPETCQE